jgi:hypothetical protein
MMTRSERDAWVAALRSGAYQQGQGKLCLRDAAGAVKYCCLGVKADLDIKAGKAEIAMWEPWDQPGEDRAHIQYSGVVGGYEVVNYLPDVVLPRQIQRDLATLNDTSGKTFEEIADWIEENVPVKEDVGR